MLSRKALEMLYRIFAEESQANMPVSVAEQVLEVRAWVLEQLKAKPSAEG